MKVGQEMHSIAVTVSHSESGANLLRRIADAVGGESAVKAPSERRETVSETGDTQVVRRRGRPTKEEVAARAVPTQKTEDEVVADDGTGEDDGLDLGDAGDDTLIDLGGSDHETSGDEDEKAEETPPPVPKTAKAAPKAAAAKPATAAAERKALTLDGDIIPAFQLYAQKHGRPASGKVLAKFGVKSVRDLLPGSYADVLKTLKA